MILRVVCACARAEPNERYFQFHVAASHGMLRL